MPRSRKALALAAGTLSVLCLPTAAGAEPDSHVSRLHGSALVLFPPSPDDVVRFTVDAYARHDDPGPYPTASWGTAHLRHYFAGHDQEIWYSIRVDCLMASGGQATVTGEVVDASPGGEKLLHTRIGFSVAERGRRDLVGFTGGASPYPEDAKELRMCTAPPPFFTTRDGGYSVSGAMHW
ncbi:hypothetical protein GCM10010112_13800 [Actinoplanes lobatus]|uniref:Uncharacterized protein n=1 Tax=Actinoplanes lobatus TaxID=113568 RepID=A0A7W7HMW1_9ACTN|nr:hypothetical protein [Actinoplanes lobatus]MBB4753217.1 hypothetical protein [Actinoplanes lobatus]GGN59159.1 hypothetical protein GCM10010112_13800 [Actinoplanes lobatus]GIE42923.1 hypothetical protein Alo02nite_58210 [Actinoplanes lobatus]